MRFGVVVIGIVLLLIARLVLRSPFFQLQRESAEDTDSPAPAE